MTTASRADAAEPGTNPGDRRVVPILRIFDWDKAEEFYLGFLDWHLDWAHRFEDDMPLYVQISRPGGHRIHLSEHHGDGTPGSALIIEVGDLDQLHAELAAKDYRYARPGIEQQPWGRTVTVGDPFGNRLTFLEHTAPEGAASAGTGRRE